jgi:hypothetical protein
MSKQTIQFFDKQSTVTTQIIAWWWLWLCWHRHHAHAQIAFAWLTICSINLCRRAVAMIPQIPAIQQTINTPHVEERHWQHHPMKLP